MAPNAYSREPKELSIIDITRRKLIVYSIGVDLGGTKILTGLVHETGVIEQTVELKTGAVEGPEAVIKRIIQSVEQVKKMVKSSQISGIGIGAPGPLNPRTGMVLSPPNLPGWDRIPLRQRIQEHFDLPSFLENDANAAALAEYRYGAGKGSKNMVYVTVSTGIGGGLILDGKLYQGSDGFAGELGHIVVDSHGPECSCGNRGCLEALASGTAIAQRAKEVFGNPYNTKEVAKMAMAGNAAAASILDEAFQYLGVGLTNIVNIFNPEKIVIGGGVAQIGEVMFKKITEIVGSKSLPAMRHVVQIVPAMLGKNAGMIGSAILPFVQGFTVIKSL